MKKFIGSVVICSFLAAFSAMAAEPAGQTAPAVKAAQKKGRKAQVKRAKARKAAVRKAKARSAKAKNAHPNQTN